MKKSEQIREILKANPQAKAVEIAKQVGCNSALVYQIKSKLNSGTTVKRGRPRKVAEPKAPTEGQLILRRVVSDDSIVINKLREEIKGYRTVISYLEHQLGLKDSQNAAAI